MSNGTDSIHRQETEGVVNQRPDERDDPLLEIKNLKKLFPLHSGILSRRQSGYVRAVDDVSLTINRGERLGLVGESGCGKTTAGRCMIRLIEPTSGIINYYEDGITRNLLELDRREMKRLRKKLQIVFQDPFSSLDPRMNIRDLIAEPLRIQKIGTNKQRTERVEFLLESVGLAGGHTMNRYPYEFSGGQRQRIGIARALSLDPEFLICDEPVSALDVSVQAQVLNILSDLQRDFGLTMVFVAHNLGVVEYISDRVCVMYLGHIMEIAPTEELYRAPSHPYTSALLRSIPEGDPRRRRERSVLQGTVPDSANPPKGCPFNTRCPFAQDVCFSERPSLRTVDTKTGKQAACHFAGELDLEGYNAEEG